MTKTQSVQSAADYVIVNETTREGDEEAGANVLIKMFDKPNCIE